VGVGSDALDARIPAHAPGRAAPLALVTLHALPLNSAVGHGSSFPGPLISCAADAYFATSLVSAGGTDQVVHALRDHPRWFEVATRPTPGSGHDGPQWEAHLACHGSTGGE